MQSKYPIEQLLRQPHEIAPAIGYFVAAILVVLSPSAFMGAIHTPVLMYSIAVALVVRGSFRAYSACRLIKYQYELSVLPMYKIKSSEIPVNKTNLFLGMGFEWRTRHTQRRFDVDTFEYEYLKDRDRRKRYRLARTYEKVVDKYVVSKIRGKLSREIVIYLTLTKFTVIKSWANPVAPIPYVEGISSIHAVGLWEGEEPVNEKQSERVAHTFVLGTTRVGKTRLAETLITQDIHNDDVVITFDPKGDADLLKRMYIEAKKAGREHQFYCFHLGFPEVSARYNPVGTFGRITEPASRISSQLPGEGSSAAFREFTWRYVNVMSKAMTAIGMKITYENLLSYGADIDPLLYKYLEFVLRKPSSEAALKRARIINWEKAVNDIVDDENQRMGKTGQGRDKRSWAAGQIFKRSNIEDSVAQALLKTFEYEKSFYDKLVASLFPLLEKLTSGPVSELLSPDYTNMDDSRPIFDWDEIISTGGIVYIGLDALSDADVSQAVGNSMFADLTSRAGEIYKHGISAGLPKELVEAAKKRKICIHADEFNELVGKEFVTLANKAGGAGFQLTVYTQTLSDIQARFGDEARAGQVIGNLGNLIMLRVKEPKTAALLTDLLPDVEVITRMDTSSTNNDSNADSTVDFTSSTGTRLSKKPVPLIRPDDLTRMPKGQAFAMLGGKVYKLRLPFLSEDDDIPEDLQFLYNSMKKKYNSSANNSQWWKLPEIDIEIGVLA